MSRAGRLDRPTTRGRRGGGPRAARPDLAAGIGLVAGALRGGSSETLAWQRGLGVRVRDGLPDPQDLRARAGDEAAAAAVVAAAAVARELGAPLVGVLDGLSDALRQDAEAAVARRTALAGPATTARLLTGLPALGLLVGLALGADPVAVLLDGRWGTVVLGAGALAWAVGRLWTAELVRRAVQVGAVR